MPPPKAPQWPRRLLILGCGHMGGAMLAGWLAAGWQAARFTVVDRSLPAAPAGVTLLRALPASGDYDAILLGIKPQALDEVAPGVARLAGRGTVVLSVLAGVELASLAARLPAASGLVRVMPNLAVAIGKSPLGLVEQGLDADARARVSALLTPLGPPEWLADEALLHAVTALAGSGPAFVYRFIDALAVAGERLGLPREQAARLALTMVEGAVLLAAGSEYTPGELARRVASPGGTTQAGLDVLDAGDALAGLLARTLAAAQGRSVVLAEAARQ